MNLGKVYNFDEISKVLDGEIINFSEGNKITDISLNSKDISISKSTLFFAIKGKRYNSHNFIDEVIQRGVKNVIVENDFFQEGINILKVKNSVLALQKLAEFHRNYFNPKIIGITGSNGKTIVKEFLSKTLEDNFNIAKNPKSYNSQIGVPLSILQIKKENNIGIFEAGISQKNEMEKLEKITSPEIGILTNIGSAHSEGFKSEDEKLDEKLKLFKNSKQVFYKYSDKIHRRIKDLNKKSYSWGYEKECDLIIKKISKQQNYTYAEVIYNKENIKIKIPFINDAYIENTIIVFLVSKVLKISNDILIKKISLLHHIDMRMQEIDGINNCKIINDYYNSDLESLKNSINFLETKEQNKILILSDILSINQNDYTKISTYINNSSINKVYLIGQKVNSLKNDIKKECYLFKNTYNFIKEIENINFKDNVILLKGSRDFHFEEIGKILQKKNHKTYLEVNLNSLSHNLSYIKSKLNKNTKVMAMVKANAYGLGIKNISLELQNLGIDYLGVAYPDEGIYLRKNKIHKPIMVMNPNQEDYKKIIEFNLEPVIYNIESLISFVEISEKYLFKNPYKIHLEFDTGMHRFGFYKNEIPSIIKILTENKNTIKLESIFSHLSESDNIKNKKFTQTQITEFKEIINIFKDNKSLNFFTHILNSSGVENYTNSQMDIVRIGIALYGISENKNFKSIAKLKTIISQIKEIKKGDSISYNRNFIAEKNMKIATIPIGYADGFSRSFSNKKGIIKINNQNIDILGSVCMDTVMVDITDINCNINDEIYIFDFNDSIMKLSKEINTIPYEIISSISERIKRVYTYED